MNQRRSFILTAALAAACASPAATTISSPTPAAAPPVSSIGSKTSTWDGIYTNAQAQRGATLFASTCNKCHGPAAAGSMDDGGRLVGREFFEKFDGVTLDQLFTTILTLMPLDHPKTLAPKDVADITSYLLSQNQMPAGSSPLPEDAAQLKGIRISASKP